MKLIVGLGNPGREYAGTRHNIGFRVVETLAIKLGAEFQAHKALKGRLAQAKVGPERVIILEPQTFMNLSGEAVLATASFYKVDLEDIVIVHDELDFPIGRMAFLTSGTPGGHKGVASVQELLGTKNVTRLRLGIDRPTGLIRTDDYVLQKFSSSDEEIMRFVVDNAVSALQDWISQGLTKSMNLWNGVKG